MLQRGEADLGDFGGWGELSAWRFNVIETIAKPPKPIRNLRKRYKAFEAS